MVRHSSRIELSLPALKNNIRFIRKRIGDHPELCCVVKANAYGHGTEAYIPMLEKAGVNYFAVASSFEAEAVHKVASSESKILIMGILYTQDLEWAIGNGIEFYAFHYDMVANALKVAQKLNRKAKIHLEVETGCNRTGLSENEFIKSLDLMKQQPDYLSFYGLCTHFAGIESLSNHFRTNRQYLVFKDFIKLCEKKGVKPKLKHIACSAAAIAFPDTAMDMVRVGIAQYGFWPSPDIYNMYIMEREKRREQPLKRVITWKTDIMDIKEVRKDEFIGYGTAYQAYQDMRVAVLPLGYSNGYARSLSNKGFVLIQGKKAPIVGLINMNLFMVDITHIPEAQINDEVVLIGKQKNNTISVSSFSNFSNQLNNELISRLPAAIPRIMVS
ncbi:MAG: alanine racemase [Cyclobacteriaceae bacterium]|nr:alanine racemase [Cyclobacteriaceae bacterium]MCH8516353.1 alanine racemase [Cyclobacteriaceae bacterium]